LLKIGYFYILKDIVIGEAVNPNDSTVYDGHAAFWDKEAVKFFSDSPEIKNIRLCWYGCNRGRITCFEGQYQFFGTPEVIHLKNSILTLFGFDINSQQVITRSDEHYKIDALDKELIDRNINFLNISDKYPYLIGLIQ
jgi:hypothetical protein